MEELQVLKNIDDLTVRDAIKRVVQVAGSQGEMYPHDFRCIDLLTKIIVSDHKFNDISIKSIMSENDFEEIKKSTDSAFRKDLALGKEVEEKNLSSIRKKYPISCSHSWKI